jgi:hypothetical protein
VTNCDTETEQERDCTISPLFKPPRKKVATAYRHLAERTENNAIKPLLSFIAGDSLKHSTILGILSQNIAKPRSTSRGCERILGKAWTTAITHAQEESARVIFVMIVIIK